MAIDELAPSLEAQRRRLRKFLHDELIPRERKLGGDAAASGELRRWTRTRSNELGIFGLTQPVELGGAGLGPLGQAALREEIAASGSALGHLALGGNGGMLRNGTAEQRERFLLPVLRGELSAAFAFTDAREGPRASAVRRGDSYLVSGVKSFVSGGPHADLLLTVAGVKGDDGTPAGVAVFIIRRESPGVVLRKVMRTLDGGEHGEFEFREVEVPAGDLLGEIGQGLPRAIENITALRLSVAATACGTARWALDYTLAQVDQPHRTGTPLAEREQVQAMLAESAMDLFGARGALYAAARAAEAGEDVEVEAAMAKAMATEAATRVVDRAIQLTGAAAVVEDHPLALAYRRIRSSRIAEGTTEILKLSVARGLLARHRAAAQDEGDAEQP